MTAIYPYALTTLQRVKNRIFDTNISAQPTAFDEILTSMINSATDWIERECGGRRFAMTFYPNQVYSAYGAKQRYAITKQSPIFSKIIAGDTVVGSKNVNNIVTAGLQPGMPILGDAIGIGNSIAAITGSTTAVLAIAATSSATGGYIQANGLTQFRWRSGTPSAPSWTPFILDQYEMVDDGQAGIIRIYGVFPRLYNNMVQISYWAGFIINWNFVGDGVNHTLPSDLTDFCENLVVRKFKRRDLAGKTSEVYDGATVAWRDELDKQDIDVLGHWRQTPTIM